jgi:hypothetical protein
MKKGHSCEKVPLLFEDTMTCRLGCAQCELERMQPSVAEWCLAGVRLDLPDDIVTEVACLMRSFHVHPVWVALSKKKKIYAPIIVLCDDMDVARMGLYGYKKKPIQRGQRDNYYCNGKTVFFCYDGEEGDMVLRMLKQSNPDDDVVVLKITGYTRE